MSSESGKERRGRSNGWVPASESERKAIRAQLERIVSSSLFKNSKRYPHFLKYVIERMLDGEGERIKERTIGIEVFGRDPDYDTNLDPIVRMTAGEIRKRLAQYYVEADHERELRIELPSGSYVPEFHLTVSKTHTPVLSWRRSGYAKYAATLIAVCLLAGGMWLVIGSRESALDKFWGPILDNSSAVVLGVRNVEDVSSFRGSEVSTNAQTPTYIRADADVQRSSNAYPSQYDLHLMGTENVPIARAITLARIIGLLQMKGKTYDIKTSISTTFADLRKSPLVLVGAFTDDWTSQLTGPLRFRLVRDPGKSDVYWIKDEKDPSRRDWSVNVRLPYIHITQDFGLISRVLDPTTQQTIVLAAGLIKYGTLAAGEFLTDPSYMEILANDAPPGWQDKNMQIVISTKVVNGVSGPPTVVATHFW